MEAVMQLTNTWSGNISATAHASGDAAPIAVLKTRDEAAQTQADQNVASQNEHWLAMAAEAEADVKAGRLTRYNSDDEMFSDLESARESEKGRIPEA
jgi:hypothetical protein